MNQEGAGPSWVWLAVAAVSGLLGVLAGAFVVWRRMAGKRGATVEETPNTNEGSQDG